MWPRLHSKYDQFSATGRNYVWKSYVWSNFGFVWTKTANVYVRYHCNGSKRACIFLHELADVCCGSVLYWSRRWILPNNSLLPLVWIFSSKMARLDYWFSFLAGAGLFPSSRILVTSWLEIYSTGYCFFGHTLPACLVVST